LQKWLKIMSNLQYSSFITDTISLVIDVTYRCNATCLYCQWSSNKTESIIDQPDNNILIPEVTLKSLGSERIVLSGGEPLIRKDLERIISYYSQCNVKSIVLISNGLLLTQNRCWAYWSYIFIRWNFRRNFIEYTWFHKGKTE